MPPVWNQRAPSRPKISSQSTSPGFSCETAVWPRSEQPSAARTPKPRSVKLRPLRTVAADAVVLHPAHALLDAALQHQVLDEAADRVVGERRDDGGRQAEAAPQPARDVVLAAALPGLEVRVVCTRPSPGSSRSITSPSETSAQRQESAARSGSEKGMRSPGEPRFYPSRLRLPSCGAPRRLRGSRSRRGPHRGPEPVQFQPTNRVRAGRQQR